MVVYQDGVHTGSVGIVIILICVTNITSNPPKNLGQIALWSNTRVVKYKYYV